MSPRRQAWLASCLLFLSAFLVYVKSFCSSVYPDDSGETATLAWTLSIGHPPGYPLHTLCARIFSLLPLGDPALRINLFASFLGALCAPLAYLAARKISSPFSATFAAFLIILGPAFWHNAGLAKGSVYMLNNLLSLSALASLLCLEGEKRIRLFFLLLGLGLAHHYMSQVVLLPAYAWLAFSPGWRRQLKQAAWLLPGLSLYLFLFIRSSQKPPINWGEIATFEDFVFFLSRAQYAAAEVSRTLATSLTELATALAYLGAEGRILASLLALTAVLALKSKIPRALLVGSLAPVLAVTLYLNLKGDRLSIMEPYLFPAYVCQALLASAGLAWILQHFGSRARIAAASLACLAVFLPASQNFPKQDKSSYHFAIDNARSVLQSLPRGAVLFSAGDAIIFPLWYLQNVKHEREDVTLVGTPVLPMDWVRHDLVRRRPDLVQPRVTARIGNESIDRLVYGMLELNQGRLPLYFSYNQLNAGIPGWRLLPQGPVYQALPSASPDPANARAMAEAKLTAMLSRGFEDRNIDSRTRSLILGDQAIHHNSYGTWLEDRKDYIGALKQYQAAMAINPQSEEFPFNAGNALNEMGQKEASLKLYEKSASINPAYESAWFNLAATHFMLNQTAEGCAALQKTLQIDPSSQAALAQKGRCPNLQ